MGSRALLEKLVLMLVGSLITYYLGIQMMQNMQNLETSDAEYSKIIKNMCIHHKDLSVTFDDVCGHDDVKKMLKHMIVSPIASSKHDICHLLSPPNGVILYGPPGTGKTMLAKAIAYETNCTFINFSANVIENKYYGESSKILNTMFDFAEKHKPAIIFIDEIDGFLGERSSFDQSFVNNIKTLMISKMDGILARDPKIILMGTTNNLNKVDAAIKRRMRTHIYIDLPTDCERQSLFDKHLSHYTPLNMSYVDIIKETEHMSGSDIHEVCKRAAHIAYHSDSNSFQIDISHITQSINEFSSQKQMHS